MVNRINIFQPDAPMSYDDRIKILKERKLEETRVKSTMKVYQAVPYTHLGLFH